MGWQDHYSRADFIELVRTHYVDGDLSATETANQIGCGVTRNVVIGIAHREKMTRKGGAAAANARRKKSAPEPKPRPYLAEDLGKKRGKTSVADKKTRAVAFVPDPVESRTDVEMPTTGSLLQDFDTASGVGFDEMANGGVCKMPLWPHGLPDEAPVRTEQMRYCGRPAIIRGTGRARKATSWCSHHAEVVFKNPMGE